MHRRLVVCLGTTFLSVCTLLVNSQDLKTVRPVPVWLKYAVQESCPVIRLLIQSVKVDKSDDVIRTLEQYRAVDGVLVTSCCAAAIDGVVAKVYAAPCGQILKKNNKKSPISLLDELPSAKFEKKRKIGFNLIVFPPWFSGWNLTWLLYFPL